MRTSTADFVAILILGTLLIVTCLVSEQRGMEAASIQEQFAKLEQRIEQVEQRPLVASKYTTVHHFPGAVEIEVSREKR